MRGAEVIITANLTTDWQQFTWSGYKDAGSGFHVGAWGSWTDNTVDIYFCYPKISDWTQEHNNVAQDVTDKS